MSDYVTDALAMSVDPELLEALGRVAWAAARLHAGIRDAINALDGAPSDAPFDSTLGQARAQLEDKARTVAREPDRSRLLAWCQREARPAVEDRNGVLHGVAFTADDGRQAIGGTTATRPARYRREQLLEVAGRLVVASRALPPGPYAT